MMGKSPLSEGLERKPFVFCEPGSGHKCLRLRKQTYILEKGFEEAQGRR